MSHKTLYNNAKDNSLLLTSSKGCSSENGSAGSRGSKLGALFSSINKKINNHVA